MCNLLVASAPLSLTARQLSVQSPAFRNCAVSNAGFPETCKASRHKDIPLSGKRKSCFKLSNCHAPSQALLQPQVSERLRFLVESSRSLITSPYEVSRLRSLGKHRTQRGYLKLRVRPVLVKLSVTTVLHLVTRALIAAQCRILLLLRTTKSQPSGTVSTKAC